MTQKEIFKKILERKVTGVMYHDKLNAYYKFLTLNKYADLHRKRAKDEYKEYLKLRCNLMSICNCLIDTDYISPAEVIPPSWYEYNRQDVSPGEKRRATKEGFVKWKKWETESKEFYLQCHNELKELNEFSAAKIIEDMVLCIDWEIREVEEMMIELEDSDYSMEVMKEE